MSAARSPPASERRDPSRPEPLNRSRATIPNRELKEIVLVPNLAFEILEGPKRKKALEGVNLQGFRV
jgi:hypothetical protein